MSHLKTGQDESFWNLLDAFGKTLSSTSKQANNTPFCNPWGGFVFGDVGWFWSLEESPEV